MAPGFIIRGNARAIAALAIGAGFTAVLYAWLAASSGSFMHWGIAVVLGAVAAVGAWLWADARTPLMVAVICLLFHKDGQLPVDGRRAGRAAALYPHRPRHPDHDPPQ